MKEEEIIIQALTEVEACRRRPGMYCGDTSDETAGSSILLREIIDNSIDELSAGYGDTILVDNDFNGYNFVADTGRGLPITMNQDVPDKTSAELSFTKFHAGSKFEGTTVMRKGLNGVGSAVCSALSEVYIVLSRITENNWDKSIPKVREVWEKAGPRSKKDLYYLIITEKGLKTVETAGRLKDIDAMLFKGDHKPLPTGFSTLVLFKADPEIWSNPKAQIPMLDLQYFLLIQEKFYGRKLKVVVGENPITNTFKPYKEEVLRTITPADTSYNPQVSVYLTFEEDPKMGKIQTYGSVNGLDCGMGFHVNLAKSLFKTAFKDYYKIKGDDSYLCEGLKLGVIMLASEVNFSSQTKENLKAVTKVKPADFAPIIKDIQKIFKKDPDYWGAHARKVQAIIDSMKDLSAKETATRIIEAASSANQFYRNKQNYVDGFVDATTQDRWAAELFLVEGLSPAGSLLSSKNSVDTKYRAILPLRGKVLDVSDCTASKMLSNREFYTLFSVLGVGIDQKSVISDCKTPEEAYEVLKKKSRFGKIVIATDSDEDGLAICKGLIYAFLKFARFIVDFRMLYIAESPIFIQNGKYFYPSDPRIPGTQFCIGMDPSKPFTRHKGLGSLEKQDVRNSFFDESTRRLIQVTTGDMDKAMELVENVDKRKQLLTDNGILTNPFNLTDL